MFTWSWSARQDWRWTELNDADATEMPMRVDEVEKIVQRDDTLRLFDPQWSILSVSHSDDPCHRSVYATELKLFVSRIEKSSFTLF